MRRAKEKPTRRAQQLLWQTKNSFQDFVILKVYHYLRNILKYCDIILGMYRPHQFRIFKVISFFSVLPESCCSELWLDLIPWLSHELHKFYQQQSPKRTATCNMQGTVTKNWIPFILQGQGAAYLLNVQITTPYHGARTHAHTLLILYQPSIHLLYQMSPYMYGEGGFHSLIPNPNTSAFPSLLAIETIPFTPCQTTNI